MKLVSIIIPAYNAEKYIRESVESALAQTYPNVEVIVIDDGSKDGTKKILEPYGAAGKIVYVYQENKGLAASRNAGIRAAKGEYVAFLDADDIFLPEKVAEQVRALEASPDFGVCYSDLLHFTDPPVGEKSSEFFHHTYTYPSGNIFGELLKRQFINPLTVMARRVVFQKYGMFDESLRRSEDWDLWLRFARAGVRFLYLDKPLAQYRVRTSGNLSSLSSEPDMKEKNLFLFLRLGEKLTPAEQEKYDFQNILARLRAKLVFAYLVVGNKKAALERAGTFSKFSRFLVRVVPAPIWQAVLTSLRALKHRLLLKKL